MHSFKKDKVGLPLGAVWLMNSVSEYKGKQELYTHQSPQALKSLREIALIESVESSNRIEGVTVDKNRLKPLVIGKVKPRDRSRWQKKRNGLYRYGRNVSDHPINPLPQSRTVQALSNAGQVMRDAGSNAGSNAGHK